MTRVKPTTNYIQRFFVLGMIGTALAVLSFVALNFSAEQFSINVLQQQSYASVLGDSDEESNYFQGMQHLPSEVQKFELSTVVLFTASWDSRGLLLRDLLSKDEVKTGYRLVEINMESDLGTTYDYEVEVSPTVILLDEDGDEITRFVDPGTAAVDRLMQLL